MRCARSPSLVTRMRPVLSCVQAPDGVQPRAGRRDEVDDRAPAVRVGRGGQHAGGLVDDEHHPLLGSLEEAPVDRHAAVDVDVAGRIGDGLAGDRDATGTDDLLRATSGSDARMGEELREAHATMVAGEHEPLQSGHVALHAATACDARGAHRARGAWAEEHASTSRSSASIRSTPRRPSRSPATWRRRSPSSIPCAGSACAATSSTSTR